MRRYGPGEPDEVFVERKKHKESWKGEESVKERFHLRAEQVVPFLEGELSVEALIDELKAKASAGREGGRVGAWAHALRVWGCECGCGRGARACTHTTSRTTHPPTHPPAPPTHPPPSGAGQG